MPLMPLMPVCICSDAFLGEDAFDHGHLPDKQEIFCVPTLLSCLLTNTISRMVLAGYFKVTRKIIQFEAAMETVREFLISLSLTKRIPPKKSYPAISTPIRAHLT
jgi:hypothetical protein